MHWNPVKKEEVAATFFDGVDDSKIVLDFGQLEEQFQLSEPKYDPKNAN